MATATKKSVKANVEVEPVLQDIRHVVRTLGPITDDAKGVQSFADFELYIKETYLDDGWDVKHVQVGNNPNQNFQEANILYVLVKRAA